MSAQPIAIGLTAADSVIPLGDDFFRGMATLFDTRRTEPVDVGSGSEELEVGCSF
jgi:hypothetical protein